MIVSKTKFLSDSQYGASMTEVLLTMAIIAIATPFAYNRIVDTNHTLKDISTAKQIIDTRDAVLNFVRINQDSWPTDSQIKLAAEELSEISDFPTAGFVDRYTIQGASVTDVYLAFDLDTNGVRTNRVVRHIGTDTAAVVGDDGIAYASGWAVTAPDFKPGNLVYRISRDVTEQDMSKYLHRGAAEDGLNVMWRNLNMGGNNIYNVGEIDAKSLESRNGNVRFLSAQTLDATNVYFSAGANMDGAGVQIDNLRVVGDVSGFRNINADVMNGKTYTTSGHIIADRATITKSVNVSRNLVLKSDSSRTISGFTGITANSVSAPFISADEFVFYDAYGLTVSGELLVSSNPPLKIGSWAFPSTTPPRFKELKITRTDIPSLPDKDEFGPLFMSGWQSVQPKVVQ